MVGRGMGKKLLQPRNDKLKGVMQHARKHESVDTLGLPGWGTVRRTRYRTISSVLQEQVVSQEDNSGRLASQERLQRDNVLNRDNNSRVAVQEQLQQEHASTGGMSRWGMGKRPMYRTISSVLQEPVVPQGDNSDNVASQEHLQQTNASNGCNSSRVASQEQLQQQPASIGGEHNKKKISRVDIASRMKDILVAQTILPPASPANHEHHSDSSGEDELDEFLQDDGLSHNQDAECSFTKGVKTRGMYKSDVIYKKTKHGKLHVNVPEHVLRVLRNNARQFVNFCGYTLRSTVSLAIDKWAVVKEEYVERMWLKVMDKFQPPDCEKRRLRDFCEEEFKRLFQGWKGRLSRHYKKCLKKGWEPLQHCPILVSERDWKHCVERFKSDKFKEVSERNSRNRNSERWIKHTTGPLSFAEVEEILTQQNNNVKPPADVIWLAQHTHRDEDGYRWVNDQRSQEVHAKLQELVEQSSQDGSNPMTDVEILTTVLEPRSGYVRGKGTGYRGHSKRSNHQEDQVAKIETLKRTMAEMKEEHERKIEELRADQDRRVQDAFAAFREEFIQSMPSQP